MIRPFRIAHRDMPRDAFIETKMREQPESSGQPLLAVQPFSGHVLEYGNRRQAALLFAGDGFASDLAHTNLICRLQLNSSFSYSIWAMMAFNSSVVRRYSSRRSR